MAFRPSDPAYADVLLSTAQQLFTFADTYRGSYSDSIPQVRPFYNSFSGPRDELVWAAAWLHRASGDGGYLDYITRNGDSLNAVGTATEFTWDLKIAGAQVLLARQVLSCGQQENPLFVQMRAAAEQYVCYYVSGQVPQTPDGLAFIRAIPFQHALNAAFVAAVYSDYLTSAGAALTCNNGVTYSPEQVLAWGVTQVDYVLGANNLGSSYMQGFGNNPPTRLHHRGASLPVDANYPCGSPQAGEYFNTPNPNAQVFVGAIVGGPAQDGSFNNERGDYGQTEPIIYINPGFYGTVARLLRGTAGVTPGCTAADSFSVNPLTNPPTNPPPAATPAPPYPNPPPTDTPTSPNPNPTPAPPNPTPTPAVTLTSFIDNTWSDGSGQPVVLVRVVLDNVGGVNVNNLVMTCPNFAPSNSWNVVSLGNGQCGLLEFGATLYPGQAYTFGYVQNGGPADFAVASSS